MNTPILHAELERLRSGITDRTLSGIHNAYEITDPFNVVDCDPNTNYDNFERLMGGDVLVYGELANSTPNNGRNVVKGFEPLVKLSARTSCVFGMTDIRRMRKCVVGTEVCTSHSFGSLCGHVVQASVLNDFCNGSKYNILCVLAWIGRKYVEERRSRNGLLYMSFGINITSETCCQCGKTGYTSPPCDHVRWYDTRLPGMSICRFKNFDRIALEE